MADLYKFPRTPHIEGSRFQPGDEDLDNVPFCEIADRLVVVEEKCDGANSGISFDENGTLMLQSRGHFLLGGARERHFNLFKQWAASKQRELWEILGRRYVLYGEWVYAKHTVFYDALPHYFLEFDMLDLETRQFLSTKRRREMLAGSPVVSVPVLFEGQLRSHRNLAGLVGQSTFIREGHLERLRESCTALGLNPERALRETDSSLTMEGLYLKTEDDEQVTARYKYVRASFLQAVEAAEGHWLNRPIIPNQLQPEVNLFDL